MRVIWKENANQHLDQLIDYGIEVFGTKAVARLVGNIRRYDKYLADNPYMGHKEPLLAKRHLPYRSLVVHPHYKLIYWVDEVQETVFIAALWDTRRNPAGLVSSV